jgi:ABC-type uncharacterized transport system permease subunit
MESALCVTGGLLTVIAAFGLTYLRSPQWSDEAWSATDSSRSIRKWAKLQRALRLCTNCLVGLIGLAIAACAFVPHGRVWMGMWAGIFLALLLAVLLAGLDALASLVGYRRAVPESARQTMSRCEPHP